MRHRRRANWLTHQGRAALGCTLGDLTNSLGEKIDEESEIAFHANWPVLYYTPGLWAWMG